MKRTATIKSRRWCDNCRGATTSYRLPWPTPAGSGPKLNRVQFAQRYGGPFGARRTSSRGWPRREPETHRTFAGIQLLEMGTSLHWLLPSQLRQGVR
jgi:hypothetical protein